MPRNPRTPRTDLTADEVRTMFYYDPSDGSLRNRYKRSRGALEGAIAGTVRGRGYIQVTIRKKCYFAHRLIWLLVTGAWPARHLDHIDRDPRNNRFDNLRECDDSENHQNQTGTNRKGTSKYLGVCKPSGRKGWRVDIGLNGKQKFLGSFRCETAAYAAYCKAKAETHKFVATDVERVR